ncbi:hypothetical protein MH117_09010 [Paenibacillus sp. ACRRX]|uniref:hypothetical protein n=1 Tax=Paenibacillus sp. ACRRX TaxID=2918206 RepID=UPI001EF55B07|nr:hypothetical protein [Paenibacillus sp. ACRRX]MCG7407561.1 hypothetical protein [Paenibacillus sp. ACRRX]
MSSNASESAVVYQATPNTVTNLKGVRERAQQAVSPYINSPVKITTIDGQIYEGVIVKVEGSILHLSIAGQPQPQPQQPMPYSYDMTYMHQTPMQSMPGQSCGCHSYGHSPSPYDFYRAFNPYYNNVILPLVLFELLVIALM